MLAEHAWFMGLRDIQPIIAASKKLAAVTCRAHNAVLNGNFTYKLFDGHHFKIRRKDITVLPVQRITISAKDINRNYWKDILAYKELIFFLCWRDVLVRYKQTAVGILWAIIRPLLTILIFSFVFHYVAKLPSEGDVPYTIMVFAAMLPWQLFVSSFTAISESLISNSALISKIYFPRIIIPISSVFVNFIDAFISYILLIVVIFALNSSLTLAFLCVIPLTLYTGLVALGIGLVFCAANVRYRDFRYIVPFVAQLGLYASPVGYSSSIVPEKWSFFYQLNPIVGVIEAFRWAILGLNSFPFRSFTISMIITSALLIFGISFFRRAEKNFSDII